MRMHMHMNPDVPQVTHLRDRCLCSPALFQRHGAADNYILPAWGKATAGKLVDEGVGVDFGTEPRLGHSLAEEELAALTSWLLRTLDVGAESTGTMAPEVQRRPSS
jgi:predicted esterase